MKKYFIRHLCTVALLLSISPTTLIAQTLRNGGFEEGAKMPDGWYPTYTDWLRKTMEHVEFKWDNEVKHSGNRSVSLEIFKGHPPYLIDYNWTATVEGYEIGKTYELTVWVKTELLKESTQIIVQCWRKGPIKRRNPSDDEPDEIQSPGREPMILSPRREPLRRAPGFENLIKMFKASAQLKGTKDWTQVRMRFKVPKGTAEVRVRMGIYTHYNNSGKVWFDDVEIHDVKKNN